MVKAVGAVIWTAATGHKMFDRTSAGRNMFAIDKVTVGHRQLTQFTDEGSHRVFYNFTLDFKPPVGNIGMKPTVVKRVGQIDHRTFAFSHAYGVNTRLLDQIREKSGMRTAKYRYGRLAV